MSPAFNHVVNPEMDINEQITLESLKFPTGEVKFYPDQSSWVKIQKPSPWPTGQGTPEYDAMPPMLHQIPECDPITTAESVAASVFSDIPSTT